MDKQMIEENGKELYNDLSSIMSEEYEKRMLITPSYCANKMLEKGYRKIPEGAVVLKMEDYNRIRSKERKVIDIEVVMKAEEKARTETAEKFAERLKTECYEGGIDSKLVIVSFSRLDEIAKEIMEGK